MQKPDRRHGFLFCFSLAKGSNLLQTHHNRSVCHTFTYLDHNLYFFLPSQSWKMILFHDISHRFNFQRLGDVLCDVRFLVQTWRPPALSCNLWQIWLMTGPGVHNLNLSYWPLPDYSGLCREICLVLQVVKVKPLRAVVSLFDLQISHVDRTWKLMTYCSFPLQCFF